jgi:hypothetical protein
MFTTLAAWVKTNCAAGAVQQVVLEAARRAELQQRDYHVAIGERLTKSGHAYLVQTYGGNLFVFALTEEQLRHYGISGMQTRFFDGHQRPVMAADPTLIVDGFEVEGADQRSWFEPIRGRCRYQIDGPLPENLCVRLELILRLEAAPHKAGRVGLFCYPRLPSGNAVIEFQFAPVARAGTPSGFLTPQTVAVFVSICTSPDGRQGREAQPISDTLGALVTFR